MAGTDGERDFRAKLRRKADPDSSVLCSTLHHDWDGGALSNHDCCSSDTWFQCDRAGTNARHCREKWSDSQPARLSGHFQCHFYYFWRSRVPQSQQDIHITEAVNVITSAGLAHNYLCGVSVQWGLCTIARWTGLPCGREAAHSHSASDL